MALFRRRSARDEVPEEELLDPSAGDVIDDEAGEAGDTTGDGAAPTRAAGEGPFDEADADLADLTVPRLDLGGLRIPGLPGVGVQVEADPNTNDVRAVTAVAGEAGVQLQVFAAPRSEGLWDEIRAEMLAEIGATADAKVQEQDGPFGRELRATIPARTPEGQQILQPLRFTGIDGPRWFLRAVFLGKAAVEPDPEDVLHLLVRQTIVVRGGDAMAPRDPLPLRLPEQAPDGMSESGDAHTDEEGDEDAVDAADHDAAPGADGVEGDDVPNRYADLDPFERGPEITEIR